MQLAQAAEVTAATANAQQVIGLRPGQPEYRILIVEDQRENWMLLQHLLETTGFKVRVAEDACRQLKNSRRGVHTSFGSMCGCLELTGLKQQSVFAGFQAARK